MKKKTKENVNRKCRPCNGRKDTMCCRQVRTTPSFRSCNNENIFKIFHNLISKRQFWSTLWSVFYPDYRKLQFDYRSNVFDRNVISACRHFAQNKHRFNKHAKFTLIGSITNTNKLKDPMRELLQRQKPFLIRTLETVQPHGLNHKLNPGGIVSNYFTI